MSDYELIGHRLKDELINFKTELTIFYFDLKYETYSCK